MISDKTADREHSSDSEVELHNIKVSSAAMPIHFTMTVRGKLLETKLDTGAAASAV